MFPKESRNHQCSSFFSNVTCSQKNLESINFHHFIVMFPKESRKHQFSPFSHMKSAGVEAQWPSCLGCTASGSRCRRSLGIWNGAKHWAAGGMPRRRGRDGFGIWWVNDGKSWDMVVGKKPGMKWTLLKWWAAAVKFRRNVARGWNPLEWLQTGDLIHAGSLEKEVPSGYLT